MINHTSAYVLVALLLVHLLSAEQSKFITVVVAPQRLNNRQIESGGTQISLEKRLKRFPCTSLDGPECVVGEETSPLLAPSFEELSSEDLAELLMQALEDSDMDLADGDSSILLEHMQKALQKIEGVMGDMGDMELTTEFDVINMDDMDISELTAEFDVIEVDIDLQDLLDGDVDIEDLLDDLEIDGIEISVDAFRDAFDVAETQDPVRKKKAHQKTTQRKVDTAP